MIANLLRAGMLACTIAAGSAFADHHLMQIEQVIAGVNGDTSAQAIQLRMRFASQGNLAAARIRAFDANGLNPVVIINFGSGVPSQQTGDRVLLTTESFDALTSPAAEPDFTLTNPIPSTYLEAGSLVFESDAGTVWWRLSWGGIGYSGSNSGDLSNDDDGDFGPAWMLPLPTDGAQAVQFQGDAGDMSTTNAADYDLTAGAATFVNNGGDSFTLEEGDPPVDVPVRGFTVQTGSHVSGNTADLRESDNEFLKIDAAFIEGGEPPYVMIVEVKLKTTEVNLTNLSILVESKLSQNGGTAKLYLRNWQQGGWTRIATNPIGKTEVTHTVSGLNPAKYVNGSGIIKLRIRHEKTTTSNGDPFRSLIDHVQALVES
jgi:hypothetical protein